ncbi:MAG: VWA domain-containing protein [Bryobacteraceae bacterium]
MRWILLLAAFSISALAQQAPSSNQPQPPAPLYKAGADLVVLDLVVRDKKGRPVRDLAPGDIEIYDNGEKVGFKGLHLVEDNGEASITGRTAGANAAPGQAALDPLRQLHLQTLVFERLGVDGRLLARQAALDLLKQPPHPNVYYAVFIIDQRLKLLQPYTSDRQAVKRAIEHATTGAYSDFTAESDGIQTQLQNQLGVSGGQTLSEQVSALQGGAVSGQGNQSQAGGLANAAMAQMQLDMLQFSQQLSREQVGRSSIYALLALVRGQTTLPGRKSVLYFTEGLYVPTSMADLFQTVISAANRNNVTFYTADIRGLQTTGDSGSRELRSAAMSATKGTYHDPHRPAPVTRDEATAQDRASEAIRMNGQNAMVELAEDTGGFFIANTNDYRIPLRRTEEEINSYYEVEYTPSNVEYDGRFRKIEVRALRAGLVIQSRSGYFALPPSESRAGAILQPFEVPLLKVLASRSLPHDLEFRSRAVFIRSAGPSLEAALVVEVPLAKIEFRPDEPNGADHARIAILALIRNAKGDVVRKIARDLPFDAPPGQTKVIRAGNFVFTDPFFVPPGRYTVEVAVLDRKADKASARKSVFLATEAAGLSVSSLMRVRDYAPHAQDLQPEDPFQYQGGRITPTLDETLHENQNATLGLFCLVTPDPGAADKPTLTVEYLQDDKVVGQGDFPLPAPDKGGRIPWALFTPVTALKPGSYQVRVIVRQGSRAVSDQTLLNVEQ